MNKEKINKELFYISLKIEELKDNIPYEMKQENSLLNQIVKSFKKLQKEINKK